MSKVAIDSIDCDREDSLILGLVQVIKLFVNQIFVDSDRYSNVLLQRLPAIAAN